MRWRRTGSSFSFSLLLAAFMDNRGSCCSIAQLCQLFVTPRRAAHQASLPFTISWSFLRLMSIESTMPSIYLILCLSPSPPALNLSQHQGNIIEKDAKRVHPRESVPEKPVRAPEHPVPPCSCPLVTLVPTHTSASVRRRAEFLLRTCSEAGMQALRPLVLQWTVVHARGRGLLRRVSWLPDSSNLK